MESIPQWKTRAMTGPKIWNRARASLETEEVYGGSAMKLFYDSRLGRIFLDQLLTKPWLSKAYGSLQSSSISRCKIAPFIKQFGIDMNEFEDRPFQDFNDFFTRKFRPGARNFSQDLTKMPAFCEGRYLALPRLSREGNIPVKGFRLETPTLFNGSSWENTFLGGSGFIARLCPVDYHRYHFPDSGRKRESFRAHGPLHSVNPMALEARPEALFTNERQITILETDNFGKLAYIEVGALMVGKIVESHRAEQFQRGDEKGYFLFGASTVILLAEPGRIQIDQEILDKSAQGIETLVKLGEPIARKA